MKYYIISIFIIIGTFKLSAQHIPDFELDEIIVIPGYVFNNDAEREQYKQYEEDLAKIYPLIVLIRNEFERVNKEMQLYKGRRQRQYMRWYANYAKDSYMHNLSGLNHRQGRLLLVMISRELGSSPYQLIREYVNTFQAVFWQLTSHVFLATLRVEYEPDENPMIEHIMKKLDNQHKLTAKLN